MTFGYHTSDDIEPLFGRVNRSFAIVVATDEKGCFGIVGCKKVEKFVSMLTWAIIEGQSNGTFLETMLDPMVVRHLANKRSGIRRGVRAGWNCVTVTSTKSLLTAMRDHAMVFGITLLKSGLCRRIDPDALTQ